MTLHLVGEMKSYKGLNWEFHSVNLSNVCFFTVNQISSNLCIFWPTKIKTYKVGERVATGDGVLRPRNPSRSNDVTGSNPAI